MGLRPSFRPSRTLTSSRRTPTRRSALSAASRWRSTASSAVCPRSLARRTAHLCILATDCEDASYKRLIEALCAQNNIDIIQVNEREKLAEWAGLVKKDREGNIKKHFKCSVVAIKDFGERTKSLDVLLQKLAE